MISLAAGLALAGALGTSQPPDIDRIEWSNYCFVRANGERTDGIVQRSTWDGRVYYTNAFREQSAHALDGTYKNDDKVTFDTIVSYVREHSMETVRPDPGRVIDGCAGFISVTRGSATTTISDFSADGPEFERFEAMMVILDHIAEHQTWQKVSDNDRIVPLMPRDLY